MNKKLGLVKTIFRQNTSPVLLESLWYDTTDKTFKYYNDSKEQWLKVPRISLSGSLTSEMPTISEIETVVGLTAAQAGAGFFCIIKNTADSRIYLVVSDGTDWFYNRAGSSGVVEDYDGNIYHTVKIGSQLWMVENLRVTHYNDGLPIVNMIYDTWQNQANSWTNGYGGYSFDTFTTSGSNITSGIKAPGGYGYAQINETISLQEWDYLYYNIDVTINSGSGLNVVLFKNGSAIGWNGLNNGTNQGGFIIVSAGNYSLGICTLTTVGIDFSATFLMADNYHRGWNAADYGCYCWYDNNINYADPYGALYNWYAVDSGYLAPEGWRIPTVTDFETLHNYLATNVGGKLKEIGTTHWDSPNTGATNESGFTAVGNGWRNNAGSFVNLKAYGTFWSQSEKTSYEGYYALLYASSDVFNYNTYSYKNSGFAVRCVKDV